MDEEKPPLDAEAIYARRKQMDRTMPQPQKRYFWSPKGTVGGDWLNKLLPDSPNLTGYQQMITSGYPKNLTAITWAIQDYRKSQKIGKAEAEKIACIERISLNFSKLDDTDQITPFQQHLDNALLDHIKTISGTLRASKKAQSEDYIADSEKRLARNEKIYELREEGTEASSIAQRSDIRLTADSVRRIYRQMIKLKEEKPT